MDTVGKGRPNVMAYTAAAVAAAHAGSWTLALQARFASSECYPTPPNPPTHSGTLGKARLRGGCYFEIL